MFGLGWGEVIVIGIVALIAIGPKELPTVLRTLAQTMGKIRRMASEFQGQFQEALREAELTDLKKHADDIVSDVTNFDPLADTKKDLEKTQQDLERSFDMPDPLATPATDTAALTDGEKLPAAALPPIDIPLPELPAPVTEKDFAPAEPPKEVSKEASAEVPKQAGSKG